MAKYDIKIRTLEFGISVVKIASQFPKTPAGFALASQVIRSGTSIGANIAEAQDAISKKEFTKTINISLKETRETLYWLILIREVGFLDKNTLNSEINEAKEIRAILSAIVKKSKSSP